MIGSAALTLGAGFAAEPSRRPAEKDSRAIHSASALPANKVQPGQKHFLSGNIGHAAERSSQTARVNTQTPRAPAGEIHQPGLNKAAATANRGWMKSGAEDRHEPFARLPVGGTAAPRSGTARVRLVAAANIGGLMASSARNSAKALDGAAFKRKP